MLWNTADEIEYLHNIGRHLQPEKGESRTALQLRLLKTYVACMKNRVTWQIVGRFGVELDLNPVEIEATACHLIDMLERNQQKGKEKEG